MERTILITGSKGFIGTELTKQLRENNCRVIGLDLVDSDEKDYIKCDLSKEDLSEIIPENLDAIIHLAGYSRDSDCKNKLHDTFSINVLGTISLMDAAMQKNAKQFIFASSEWVYGETKEQELKDEESAIEVLKLGTEYALSKAVCEGAIKQKYGREFCHATICRFGIVYGPRINKMTAVESIFESIRTKEEVEIGSLKSGRCFVHVEDLVRGIVALIGLEGFNIINLVGNELNTMSSIVETSKKVTGKNPKIIKKDSKNYNVRNISNKKAQKLLNWHPKYSLEEGLKTLL